MSWENWIQDVGGSVIKSAAESKFQQPYEIDKLKLQALGQNGVYTEGKAQSAAPAGGLTITPGMLLLGGAVALFVVMQD